MNRYDMIEVIGKEYLQDNIEGGEFSYPKAYKGEHLTFTPIKDGNRTYEKLDIRFVKKKCVHIGRNKS